MTRGLVGISLLLTTAALKAQTPIDTAADMICNCLSDRLKGDTVPRLQQALQACSTPLAGRQALSKRVLKQLQEQYPDRAETQTAPLLRQELTRRLLSDCEAVRTIKDQDTATAERLAEPDTALTPTMRRIGDKVCECFRTHHAGDNAPTTRTEVKQAIAACFRKVYADDPKLQNNPEVQQAIQSGKVRAYTRRISQYVALSCPSAFKAAAAVLNNERND